MQFAGRPLTNSAMTVVSLRRGADDPLQVKLVPLPLGFHQRLRNRGILPPTAPVKVARDSAGKPLRDAQGLAVTLADTSAADYVTALDQYHQIVAVLTVVEGLRGDENIAFDAVPPGEQAGAEPWKNYALSVFSELEQAGFAAGDLVVLCRQICRLSNLLEDHLTTAQASFSGGPAAHSD